MRTKIKLVTGFGGSCRLTMKAWQRNSICETVSVSVSIGGIELPIALGRYNKMPRKTSTRVSVYVNTTFNIAVAQCTPMSTITITYYHGDMPIDGDTFSLAEVKHVHVAEYRRETDNINKINNYSMRPRAIEIASMRKQLNLPPVVQSSKLPSVVQSMKLPRCDNMPLTVPVVRPTKSTIPSYTFSNGNFTPIGPPKITKPHVDDVIEAARTLVSFSKKRSCVIDTPGKRRRVQMLISSIVN